MKFSWCTISVNDIDESIKFYEEIAGLSVNRRFKGGSGAELAFLSDEGSNTEIELICAADHKVSGSIEGISLGFQLKTTVDEAMQSLQEKGIVIDSGPFQPNPHVKFFYVRDPSGVKIQLFQNM